MDKKSSIAFLALMLITVLTAIALVTGVSTAGEPTIVDKVDRTKEVDPGKYGNIMINNKTGEGMAMQEVEFPHWLHRSKFTCKVCHTEIGYKMKAGANDFVQADIDAGKDCGICHNGKAAFAATDCDRCHTGGMPNENNSVIGEALHELPVDDFGNKINWVKALRDGNIKPKASVDGSGKMTALDTEVLLEVKKFTPAPPKVLFPHKAHTEWLDCSSCHPEPFKEEKGSSSEMSMRKILSGQYCGACHGKVAFPLTNCFRCHSAAPEPIEPWPDPYAEDADKDKKSAKDKKSGKTSTPDPMDD